jgi:hypothetical protein
MPIEGLEIRSTNDAGAIKYQPTTLTLRSKEKALDSKENSYYKIGFMEIDGQWRCSNQDYESWSDVIAATEVGEVVEVRLSESPPSDPKYPPWHNIQGWKKLVTSTPTPTKNMPSAPAPSAASQTVRAEYMVADLAHYQHKDAMIAMAVVVKGWVDMATGSSDFEQEAVEVLRKLEGYADQVLMPKETPEPAQPDTPDAPNTRGTEEVEW